MTHTELKNGIKALVTQYMAENPDESTLSIDLAAEREVNIIHEKVRTEHIEVHITLTTKE